MAPRWGVRVQVSRGGGSKITVNRACGVPLAAPRAIPCCFILIKLRRRSRSRQSIRNPSPPLLLPFIDVRWTFPGFHAYRLPGFIRYCTFFKLLKIKLSSDSSFFFQINKGEKIGCELAIQRNHFF